MAPAVSSAAAAISKYDQIKSADRFIESAVALSIASRHRKDGRDVLREAGLYTKEAIQSHNQTDQSALRQDGLAFASVYQRDSAVQQTSYGWIHSGTRRR